MDSRLIVSLKRAKNFYGSKIKVLSPAKINLYLNITGKYPGGFHKIESIVERISLFDEVTLQLSKKTSINISSNIPAIDNKNNLCYKAANLFKTRFKIPYGFKINLKKNIPIGSGLGGGSSNAASVILGINKILKLRLAKEEIFDLGKRIGSDVNFFLAQTQFACLRGRGEIVETINTRRRYIHTIIWPGLNISTAEVYNSKTAKLTNIFNNANILRYALEEGNIFLLRKCIYNALEGRACSTSCKLTAARNVFFKKEIPAFMTGSGSAFFTIGLKSYNSPESSLTYIRRSIPKKWSLFKVHTF